MHWRGWPGALQADPISGKGFSVLVTSGVACLYALPRKGVRRAGSARFRVIKRDRLTNFYAITLDKWQLITDNKHTT